VSAGLPAVRPAILAIDGGNSKTDAALVGADGTLLAQVRGPGTDSQHNGVEPTMRMLDGLVAAVARQAGLAAGAGSPVATHTSACLANADLPEEEEELAAALAARAWSVTSSLFNDTFAVLRAGRFGPEHWGVAVTCGAGINCVGVAPDGRTNRFLALGQETGDWGGGGGLGMESVWWAMRAEDGRGPQTMLREAVAKHFGVSEIRDVAIGIHRGTIGWSHLLGLAPVLFELADRGDDVARGLVSRQAQEICLMAQATIRRLGLTDLAVPVVLGGGLLTARNPLLTEGISAGLTAAAPRAVMRIVDVPPIAGAALLGLDQVGAQAGAKERLRAGFAAPTFPGQSGHGRRSVTDRSL
jgi:N-acetylglucosamine kinase-like BadF-type ATPase